MPKTIVMVKASNSPSTWQGGSCSPRHEKLNWRTMLEGVGAFLHFRMAFHISSPCLLAFVRMDLMILTADSAFPFAFG